MTKTAAAGESKGSTHRMVAVVLSIIGLWLRFQELAGRGFTEDEIYQYSNIAGTFKPFWAHMRYGDHTTFPGEYLLTYPFTQIFGMNKWGLAIPHILLTVLGFYWLYRLCIKFFQTPMGTLVAFLLVCFNSNLIFHSFEYRPYAVLPTLALGCLFYAGELVERFPRLSGRQKYWAGIYFFMATNYHAYGILISTLPFLFVLSRENKGQMRRLAQQGFFRYLRIIFIFSVLVWAWYASFNFFGLSPNTGPGRQSLQPTFEFIGDPGIDPVAFVKGVVGNLVGNKRLYILLWGLPLAFMIANHSRRRQAVFFAWMVVLPLILILYIDLRSQYWFVQRQFVWVMVWFAFLLGWCWDSLLRYFQAHR